MIHRLFCITLLLVILAGCAPDDKKSVTQLWVDCPGEDIDFLLCENCELVYARMQDDRRWYGWSYWDDPKVFTVITSADCKITQTKGRR